MKTGFEIDHGSIDDIELNFGTTLFPQGRHKIQIKQGNQEAALEFSGPQEAELFALELAQAARKYKKNSGDS